MLLQEKRNMSTAYEEEMRVSVFNDIKERVTALDAVTHYGISVNRKGMCCCPFHNDKNPSMKVDRRYHCFGCGADGDVIDFVSDYFGLSAIDAAKKLNDDFCLGISFEHDKRSFPKTDEQLRQEKKLMITREIVRAFDIMRRDAINILSNYYRLLWDWKKEYEPSEGDADWHPFFVEAIGMLDFVNEILDDLTFGNRDEQLEILETYGEEIKRIGERIKNFN